eukprot:m.275562 g.275562  ORF g.275562 m.275562 type:complete len:433 (+) comp26904_c0_seq7:357-1655(+)
MKGHPLLPQSGAHTMTTAPPPRKTGSKVPILLAVTLTTWSVNALSGKPFGSSPVFTYLCVAVLAVGVGSWAVGNRRRFWRWKRRTLPVAPNVPQEIAATRVYAISDMHTDVTANLEWLQGYADQNGSLHADDLIIVAGDVSDSLDVVRETLEILTATFGAGVAFVPGNHDLWCGRSSFGNSLEKLDDVLKLCEELGVLTKPFAVQCEDEDEEEVENQWEDPEDQHLLVIPLMSWYHSSWDVEPDIPGLTLPPVRLAAADFRRCKWPSPLDPLDDSVAKHFDKLNDAPVAAALKAFPTARILSFSHFLPFQQLIPEKRMLFYPHLPKMVGSMPLRDRLRLLRPSCHIFGHTHFAWDSKIEGIRFIQAPVGYPSERDMAGGPGWRPFLVFEQGDFVNYPQPCRWSDYFRENVRDPHNFDLAPWVKDKWSIVDAV